MALRAVVSAGLALVPLWGYALPHYLLLDDLAIGPACAGGAIGASATVAATALVWRLRRRPGAIPAPHRSAFDLALLSTVAALAVWMLTPGGGRVPYLEGFALASLHVAAGWGAALAAYVIFARARRAKAAAGETDITRPAMRNVFMTTSLGLALVAAIVLGVGSAGRASGARTRQIVGQAQALASLGAAILDQLPAGDAAGRDRVLQTLHTHGEVHAELRPDDSLPVALSTLPPGHLAASGDGWLAMHGPSARFHYTRRALATGGFLWIRADVLAAPAVLAPDDAPGLLLLALLVLAAPLAAGVVANELSGDLGEVSRVLRRAGQSGAPVGLVPVRGNDEIGDLAVALNEALRAREEEVGRLAQALDGAAATDRARSRFLAGASHELRTPLNAITGYCHLLQRGELGPLEEAQREDVTLIEAAGQQLLGHVDEILDLSRIEAGHDAPLERRETDLCALVRQVCQSRANDVRDGLVLSVHADPATPRLRVDPLRIRQILENLVGNALKFTHQGHVLVTVGPEGGGARIQVTDTGPGIPPAELESIFEEFHRVESQRQVAGTGLGLAIARRLVQQHGGRLWAESALGHGATFHLVLPADEAAAS